MTTTSAPFGFMPIRHAHGGATFNVETLNDGIATGYATSIGAGCPVKLVTGGTLERAAATDALIYGIFAGCFYVDSSGRERTSAYWPASTTATVIRAMWWRDPFLEYKVQSAGSVAQTAIGDEADHVQGTVSTLSGRSADQLSTTLAGAGASAQFRVVGLLDEQGNAWGDTYTIVRVVINESAGILPNQNAV